jgi:predicted negative regulator of RcsB-dependent stress response
MSDIDKATKIKNRIERMKKDTHRAEGAFETIMNSIKKDFECDTLEEAEETLEQLKEELSESRNKLMQETVKLQRELNQIT